MYYKVHLQCHANCGIFGKGQSPTMRYETFSVYCLTQFTQRVQLINKRTRYSCIMLETLAFVFIAKTSVEESNPTLLVVNFVIS